MFHLLWSLKCFPFYLVLMERLLLIRKHLMWSCLGRNWVTEACLWKYKVCVFFSPMMKKPLASSKSRMQWSGISFLWLLPKIWKESGKGIQKGREGRVLPLSVGSLSLSHSWFPWLGLALPLDNALEVSPDSISYSWCGQTGLSQGFQAALTLRGLSPGGFEVGQGSAEQWVAFH